MLEKCVTARRFTAWSVGITFVQFLVFSIVFKAVEKIEDAAEAALVVASAAAFVAAFIVLLFAAAFIVALGIALASMFATMFITASVSAFDAAYITVFGIASVAFAALVAHVARHQYGTKGSFGALFYIALPLGIAGAIFAFAKTGSWWLGVIILLIDIFGKMNVARRAECEKPATAATV